MLLKMDSRHLITHKDTSATIKRTHTFLIINIIAMVILVSGSIGWLVYAHSSNKWPYEPYVRKSGPPGTTKLSDYIKTHQGNGSEVTDTTTPNQNTSNNSGTNNA